MRVKMLKVMVSLITAIPMVLAAAEESPHPSAVSSSTSTLDGSTAAAIQTTSGTVPTAVVSYASMSGGGAIPFMPYGPKSSGVFTVSTTSTVFASSPSTSGLSSGSAILSAVSGSSTLSGSSISSASLEIAAQITNGLITETSCRTWLLQPTSLSGATQDRTTTPPLPASMTTSCVPTTTRLPRIALMANGGVYANVRDKWGTCGKQFYFQFNQTIPQELLSIQYYDDANNLKNFPCGGEPSKTMSCTIGASGTPTQDETWTIGPTSPMVGPLKPDQTGVGWVRCR